MRTGGETSKSIKYSQEVTSPDDEPERAGRSLVTTNHEVIREWAEQRQGDVFAVRGSLPGSPTRLSPAQHRELPSVRESDDGLHGAGPASRDVVTGSATACLGTIGNH